MALSAGRAAYRPRPRRVREPVPDRFSMSPNANLDTDGEESAITRLAMGTLQEPARD